MVGAKVVLDVESEMDMGGSTEKTLSLDVGLGGQPTQPPHPQLVIRQRLTFSFPPPRLRTGFLH